MSRSEAFETLENRYDGYHFCWPSPDVYNPFSLVSALDNRKIDERGYADQWADGERRVVKVGVNFSHEERTIEEGWIVQEA